VGYWLGGGGGGCAFARSARVDRRDPPGGRRTVAIGKRFAGARRLTFIWIVLGIVLAIPHALKIARRPPPECVRSTRLHVSQHDIYWKLWAGWSPATPAILCAITGMGPVGISLIYPPSAAHH
jgi:hypothetical protein